jgi:hypothetical protein
MFWCMSCKVNGWQEGQEEEEKEEEEEEEEEEATRTKEEEEASPVTYHRGPMSRVASSSDCD